MHTDSTPQTYFRQQARLHDRDRYLVAMCLAPRERDAMLALLAFNIEISRVPESVSEPMIGHIRYAWWREALSEIEAGRVREHPVVKAIAEMMQAGHLRAADFLPLLDARESQFEQAGFATLAVLEKYAADSSASLLYLGLKSCGLWRDEYSGCVHHLGVAWALSGMLRILPHMAAQDRSPFPQELLRKHGMADLRTATEEQKHHAAIAASHELLEIAKGHLNQVVLSANSPKLLSVQYAAARHYIKVLERHRNRLLTLPPQAGRLMLPLKLLAA